MLKCEKCLKKDVCGKQKEVNNLMEKLTLNADLQNLINNNITFNLQCNNFYEMQNKILRGE